jgi:hypothetical protein
MVQGFTSLSKSYHWCLLCFVARIGAASAAVYSWASIGCSQLPQTSRAPGLAHAFCPHSGQAYLILFFLLSAA